MKLKKILLQLGLLLAFVGVGIGGMVVANAATIPSGSVALNMNTSGKVFDPAPYNTWTVVPDIPDGYDQMGAYPVIKDIRADKLSSSGRLTSSTTKIWVLFSSSSDDAMSLKNNVGFNHAYADFMRRGGASVATTSAPDLVKSGSPNSITMPNSYQEIDVDLSHINQKLPLYVGIRYITSRETREYYGATINADPDVIKNMKDVVITPTAGTDTAGVSNLLGSNTSISGTGEPNTTAAVTLNGTDYTAPIDSNGDFKLQLPDTLNNLGAGDTVSVTESTDDGDSKSSSANVKNSVPLTITPATSNLTISPDDWDANIKGKSSSDIATWLAKQANLVVTKQNSSTALTASGDGLAFDTASDLSTLAGGDTQAVQINASDTAGDKSTDPATISVTRGLGNMQFTTISQLVFGNGVNLAVPSTQTLYAPGKYNVDVSDSRATGSPWYLTAQASTLTDGDGGHSFSGHVVYADGNGTVTPLDDGNAVQVASGSRSTSTYDLASDWNQKGDSYTGNSVPAGVYLQANPNVYAGSGTEYGGSMIWTLSDAPKGN